MESDTKLKIIKEKFQHYKLVQMKQTNWIRKYSNMNQDLVKWVLNWTLFRSNNNKLKIYANRMKFSEEKLVNFKDWQIN